MLANSTGLAFLAYNNNGILSEEFDNFRVRHYASSPPTVSAPGAEESLSAEITSYAITGETGTAIITSGSTAGTISVAVPHGTNVSALVATFTTGVASNSVKVGTITQVSGTTANNFASPVIYVVTAQDGTTTKNWTVTVTVALVAVEEVVVAVEEEVVEAV